MSQNRITFFPVGNGDTTLFEVAGKTVLTDVNYREDAAKPEKDEYDFAPDLQQACLISEENYRLSLFILTHPDSDHLRGFTDLFFSGDPQNYSKRSEDDEKLILIEEMWISPYSENPNYKTDESKPVFKEINRRIKLRGTEAGKKDGNRIKTLNSKDTKSGKFSPAISWELFAPTPEEAKVKGVGSERGSSNDTSLVINWKLSHKGGVTSVLMGGDATVEIWDRIWADFQSKPGKLRHHILLAPHHCSRGALARKQEDDSYKYSDDTLQLMGEFEKDGFVVSSSKQIKRNDDNPPSWSAKQKYLKLLEEKKDENHEDRFLNPDTHKDGKPEPVVFELSGSGPVQKRSKSNLIYAAPIAHTTTYGSL